MSVCMSAVSAGISEVLIKYTGKYVNIYFIMKITFFPRSGDFALVLGNSVRVWGILALALKFLCSLFPWDFRTIPLAAMVVWPFSSVWLSCA